LVIPPQPQEPNLFSWIRVGRELIGVIRPVFASSSDIRSGE